MEIDKLLKFIIFIIEYRFDFKPKQGLDQGKWIGGIIYVKN